MYPQKAVARCAVASADFAPWRTWLDGTANPNRSGAFVPQRPRASTRGPRAASQSIGPAERHACRGRLSPAPVSIRINVVVTDKRGRSLLDLKPTDFQLDDNGVAQSLASVELRTPARPSAVTAAPVTSIQTDEDERKAAQEAGARVFAVFLDEFNVTPGVNSERVRDAARRFLSDYVRPGDLIHVLKPLDPVSGFRFTRDRDAARAVIEKFEGRKGDYTARTPFETQYFGRTPEAVENARAQIVTTGLRELTMKIGDLNPTRGALVLISEGFVKGPGAERRRLPDWQSLARAASHFSLPIYALDPRDPPPVSDDPAAPTAQRSRPRYLAIDRRPDRWGSCQRRSRAAAGARANVARPGRVLRADVSAVPGDRRALPSDRRSHYTEGRPDPRAIWILVAAQQRVADVARALVRAPGAVGTSSGAAPEPLDRHLVWIRAR